MLILPKHVAKQVSHEEKKQALRKEFNIQLEKLLVQHKNKDRFWILGKVKPQMQGGVEILRCFLQACEEIPPFVTNSIVYYVDMRKGTKEYMWWVDAEGCIKKPNPDAKLTKLEAKGRSYAVPPTELQTT